jgi:ribonuclease HIII
MTLKQEAKQKIETIKKTCGFHHFSASNILEKEYNYELNAVKNGLSIKIQVYFGKKGVKTILQGDEKSVQMIELRNLIYDEPELLFSQPEIPDPPEYIGTDECGKGDIFGPLVVGAVFVNEESKLKLKKIGVRDSKELSETQITSLAREVKKIAINNYSIVRIEPTEYNSLYLKYLNLNKFLGYVHSKAISNLLDNIKCDCVITDKFSSRELEISTVAKYSNVNFIQIEKGESYIGVAAASILARDNFNDWFNNTVINGLSLSKGASIEVQRLAKMLYHNLSKEKIESIAKLHFKTFKSF